MTILILITDLVLAYLLVSKDQ